MSSSQHPGRKRPRFDSNNNVNSQNNNCNTSNINLLSLPDEALNNIISYSLPQTECHAWEWIGRLSQICRSFRRLAQTYAPTRIVLTDFRYYTRLNSGSHRSVDVREEFLRSLRNCSWKRQHLKEFHVNYEAVLRIPVEERFERRHCSTIKALLRTLITTPSSFLELEWLDIELHDEFSNDYHLVNAESLQLIPDALPALQKLCLSNCFKKGIGEISPHQLRQFFANLKKPLTSLSLCGPEWMTDAHVEGIMSIIGENLVRLELVDCIAWDVAQEEMLSDNSLVPIAHHCKQLKSFSMVGSHITSRGLEMVLSANMGITTLNLSSNRRLDTGTVDIISKYLPRLEELRNSWYNGREWLSDDGLIALVDAQEKESDGSGIFLKLLSLNSSYLTIRGVKHAIEKGVKEIEIDEGELHDSSVDLGSDVKLYQANHLYVDGSKYER